jgi:hypothetical protein
MGGAGYLVTILLLMVVLPVVSMLLEAFVFHGSGDFFLLLGRWFVFWGVGVRLFAAGIRQVTRPQFTAQTIFRITDPAAEKLVTEIGIGNLAIGLVGLLSVWIMAWVPAAATAGAVFLGFAGAKHFTNTGRSRTENIAMWSDLWVAAVLLVYLVARARTG